MEVTCECGKSYTAKAAGKNEESNVGKLIEECRRTHGLTQAQWSEAHSSIMRAKDRVKKANTSSPMDTR